MITAHTPCTPSGILELRDTVGIGGCWITERGTLSDDGYARLFLSGRMWILHRYAYIAYKGPIPEGMEIDHLCSVRRCFNPAHLEAVTHLENARRGFHATKTHCIHGHEYTPENTYLRPKATGTWQRMCRSCNNERHRRIRLARKLQGQQRLAMS